MTSTATLSVVILACALTACSFGARRSGTLNVPAGGPRNAQDMVSTWDAKKDAERRCSWKEAGQQVDGTAKKTNTSCGDYKP